MGSTRSSSASDYEGRLSRARGFIEAAERIVVGAGAGLSASGGLDYLDSSLVEEWFPQYYRRRFRSLPEIQGTFWDIGESEATLYWGYWAQHIARIRYEPPALAPYEKLFALVRGKKHFVCTTNVDGQLEKAGFLRDRIFAPQGDYALFQCSRPCGDEVYPNESMVRSMLEGIREGPDGLPRIRELDIPRCPLCGSLLKPNLRCDDSFVEKPHLASMDGYGSFVGESIERSIPTLLLELGVGFNTPSIIRFPFERLAREFPRMSLIRVNRDHPELGPGMEDRAVGFAEDIATILEGLSRLLL